MITNEFDYEAPRNLKQVQKLLSANLEDNKVIAGGMSLVPMMSLGLVAPSALISLRGVTEMNGISEEKKSIAVGAMTSHYEISGSETVLASAPLLAEAASQIGDVQVRNRGTIGGSLAHADPAANYLPTVIALGAEIETVNGRKRKRIPARDFFKGLMTTSLEPGELIVAIHLPKDRGNWGYSFVKFTRVKGNFPIIAAACEIDPDTGNGCLAVGGATGVPAVVEFDQSTRDLDEQIRHEIVHPLVDANGSAEYKTEMAVIFGVKAVENARERLS